MITELDMATAREREDERNYDERKLIIETMEMTLNCMGLHKAEIERVVFEMMEMTLPEIKETLRKQTEYEVESMRCRGWSAVEVGTVEQRIWSRMQGIMANEARTGGVA